MISHELIQNKREMGYVGSCGFISNKMETVGIVKSFHPTVMNLKWLLSEFTWALLT